MKEYKDWEHSAFCNVHNNGDGTFVFTCFNCGKEEIFTPEWMTKTTREKALLYREKEKLKQELKNLIN
jgi:predicted RNA-binding Zn-ribbon protein involved in translation (DUF1610 family)